MRRQLGSFYRRRINVPVGSNALVLDVGSGDKPHWRADVLLDPYVGHEHGGQRSGTAEARVARPLFDADAASMPFADKVFDYVICSHVLEHVPDPLAVARELTRVARAGYVEVPEAASAKILDFPSHLWWCRLDGSTLVFTAKTARSFDAEIAGYLTRSGIERRMATLLDSEFDHRIVAVSWTDTLDVRVEGELDEEFVAAALSAEGHHRAGATLATRALTWGLTMPLRSKRRRADIRFDDLVKPEFRTGTRATLRNAVYSDPREH